MNTLIQEEKKERLLVFEETAARCGLDAHLVEKDFWVCWTLRFIFQNKAFGEYFTFRGGTSLSKAFGCIQRFSEDIDLAISREWLGVVQGDPGSDPTVKELSKSQRDNRIKSLKRKCRKQIGDVFLLALDQAVREATGSSEGWKLECLSEKNKPDTVLFHFPTTVDFPASSYNKPTVKIEISPKAEREPSESRPISSFVAEQFPDLMSDGSFQVETLLPTRTFWEKAAAVHEQNTLDGNVREHYSRHYYDLMCLVRSGYVDFAIFDKVMTDRADWHPSRHVNHLDLKPESLILRPPPNKLQNWKRDYDGMQIMFFETPPPFDEVVDEICKFQEQFVPSPSGKTKSQRSKKRRIPSKKKAGKPKSPTKRSVGPSLAFGSLKTTIQPTDKLVRNVAKIERKGRMTPLKIAEELGLEVTRNGPATVKYRKTILTSAEWRKVVEKCRSLRRQLGLI